ncbi:MAG: D-aminoacyl-tRNA deacylase [Gammaproteobacteria bacterium]|nr:D-aminoacyl-tRNA deacylase [Gammaproteobacteria bacterium]MDH5735654.1 D-aminoacyl-tRNA deacylase [Gammaproteobacteria bacterium]
MIALLQRVSEANVRVNAEEVGRIQKGLLVLIGVEKGDNEIKASRLVERLLGYRVFEDDQGKMNLSLKDIQGDLLLVSQFTLVADTNKGTRPSFSSAAPPEEGEKWFNRVVELCRQQMNIVEVGVFGADMKVGLINDGPVTFWLQV